MQTRDSFGEAKSLAGTLADREGIRFGILTTGGTVYAVVSEHDPFFQVAESMNLDTLVAVVSPGQSKEDVYKRALEQIAYPENWPEFGTDKSWDITRTNQTRLWMQSIAANALTNGGK